MATFKAQRQSRIPAAESDSGEIEVILDTKRKTDPKDRQLYRGLRGIFKSSSSVKPSTRSPRI